MDGIDVSIGLSPTLQLLARYHQSGVLRAKMPYLPGMPGKGMSVIEVIGGKIVSCFIQNEKGYRRSLLPEILARFDTSRGPFEWRFFYTQKPQKSVPSSAVLQNQASPFNTRPLTRSDIPQVIAHFNADVLTALSSQQKRALRMTYTMINGRRTLGEIEAHAPLPKGAVHQAIIALMAMRVIIVIER